MTRRLIAALLLIILSSLFFSAVPAEAAAPEFRLNVSFVKQNDGTTSSELWYNDHVVWRLTLLADGAGMVMGHADSNTTFIAPDMSNGFFLLKIYNQP